MGSITKRQDNAGKPTYQARVRQKGAPPRSRNFINRAEAERWINRLELALEQGTAVDDRPLRATTLADLLRRYAQEVTPTKKGAADEAIRIQAMLRWQLVSYSLAALTGDVMRQWRDARLCEVAGSTVNRELNLLGHVFETARKEWGIGLVNAVQQIRRPKNPRHRDRRLSPEEEDALLTASESTRGGYLRNLILLALETAMRRKELLSVQWRDVHMAKRYLYVRESKTGQSRGVPLSRKALEILACIERRGQSVFEGVTYEAVKNSFPRTCQRASISNLRFHDLRHEATSRLVEKGLSIPEVASITGHASATMLQTYVHLHAWKLATKLD